MVVQTQRVLASATLQPNRQYNNSSPLIRNEEHICWKKHLKITRWRFTMGDIPPGRHHFTQWNAGPHLGCASHLVSGYFNHKNMWGYWYPMISYQHLSESINQWSYHCLLTTYIRWFPTFYLPESWPFLKAPKPEAVLTGPCGKITWRDTRKKRSGCGKRQMYKLWIDHYSPWM